MLSFYSLFLLFHPLPPSVIVFLAFSFSTYFLSMLFFLSLLFSPLSLTLSLSSHFLRPLFFLSFSQCCFFSTSLLVLFHSLSPYPLPPSVASLLLLLFSTIPLNVGFFFYFLSPLFHTFSQCYFLSTYSVHCFFLFLLYQLTLSVGFSPPPTTTIRWSFSSSSFSFYIPPSLSVSLPPPLTLFPFSFSLQRKLITRNITLRRIMRPSTAVDITKWSLIQWYNFIPRRQSRNKELALYIMRLSLVMQLHVCVYLSIYHWNIISGK